jgi:hypothetical protein
MEYLNRERLQSLSREDFENRKPYPWVDIEYPLTPEGYQRLRETLPPVESFNREADIQRDNGQSPRDSYLLHHHPGVELAEPWLEFMAELEGPVYEAFLLQMLGPHTFIPTFDWTYAKDGFAEQAQCDAVRKLATHIFYFNTEEDWKREWGGDILIFDAERRMPLEAHTRFEEMRVAASLEPCGNGSLLYKRTERSWHGARPVHCPAGSLRRLFVVTVNVPCLQVWWRNLRGRDPEGFRLKAA